MALIGTSTIQVPGITEEPQTGGGTPIKKELNLFHLNWKNQIIVLQI